MSRGRGVRSRVGRLESARARRGAAAAVCGVCGGDGYPATFVRTGGGGGDRRVGTSSCPGCGRVRVGAVVVLPGSGGEWAGGDDEGAAA